MKARRWTIAPTIAWAIIMQCGALAPSVAATTHESFERAIRAGDGYYARGQPGLAVTEWSKAYSLATEADAPREKIEALAKRADAYRELGYYKNASEDLGAAARIAESIGDDGATARLRGSLGNLLLLAGRPAESEKHLRACLSYAKSAGETRLEAHTLNKL